MPRMFGVYGPAPTAAESYQDGEATGRAWDAPWTPGGPWVCRTDHMLSADADWQAFCAASVENNNMWMAGWKAGLDERRRQQGRPHHETGRPLHIGDVGLAVPPNARGADDRGSRR